MKFKLNETVKIAGTVLHEGDVIEVIEAKDRVASRKVKAVSSFTLKSLKAEIENKLVSCADRALADIYARAEKETGRTLYDEEYVDTGYPMEAYAYALAKQAMGNILEAQGKDPYNVDESK